MEETYQGSLDVKPTPELNPVVTNLYFGIEGVEEAIAYFVKDKVKRDNQILTDIHPVFGEDAGDLFIEAKNEGDETITVRVVVKIDDITVLDKISAPLSPGGTDWWANYGPHPEWVTPGTHNIAWELYAEAGESIGPSASLCESGDVNYIIPALEGDITRIEVDGELLPEDGTLDWTLGEEASVRVYFKNTGDIETKFSITVTYDDSVIFDILTDSIPADGIERYVDCGTFIPDTVGVHILKATLTPVE